MSDRESRVQLRVGLFVLAAVILFVAFVLTIGSQTRVFQTGYMLRASFSSAEGLIVEVTVGSPDRKALDPMALLHTIDPMNYAQLLAKGDQIMTSVSKLALTMEE